MEKKLWLGIETTGPTGGAALVENDRVLAEEFFPVVATHSEKLLPGISKLMGDLDVTGGRIAGIAVSAGPGSYTGLRIGIATAQGLAGGWNAGLAAVGTLRILAASVGTEEPVLACVRARKNEVFAAVYSGSSPDSGILLRPGVYTVPAILKKLEGLGKVTAVGNGQRGLSLPGNVAGTDEDLDVPRPSLAAVLGRHRAMEHGFDRYPVPVYLRDFNQRAETVAT
ncbi:MAG: tRNA (adenosine(37)-N6)-threonylcarbamoyltransferase complex dimerization subunit type 1 TsaB [Candidatus Aegiribacteria sp.]